jgi:large conductance mechanosensitive channel
MNCANNKIFGSVKMKKIKKFFQDFKAFITRGNVVDMAVAVIIGAAFSAIVTALTNGIIMPLINWAVGGKDGLGGLTTMLRPVYTTAVNENGIEETIIDMTNSIYIDWGTFINKVIDFLLIALVLFIIIKVFMSLQNARKSIDEKAKKRAEKIAAKYKKQGLSEEEAKAKAEAETAAEPAAAEPAKPTTEELLTEIRDLLAANKTDKQ